MQKARVDIAVMGAGLAGLTAACRAQELGASVLVLEAGEGERYPANSRYTGGVFHVAFEDVTAGPEALSAAITAAGGDFPDPDLARAYAGNAGRAVDWLASRGADFGQGGDFPWMSRMLKPFSLREPGFRNHWPDKGAERLLDRLRGAVVAAGGQVRTGWRGQSLVMEDGRCTGLEALSRSGERLTVTAKAVILADGGFQGDPDLVRTHISPMPERLCTRGAGTGRGDGLKMAAAVGAELVGLNRFYGHVQASEALTDDRLWPYPILDLLASSAVVVGPDGRRFTDEGKGGVPLTNAIAALPDPLSSFVIFDAAIWEGPGRAFLLPPNPTFEERGVQIFRADSLTGLALGTGLPPQALAETIAGYNQALAHGRAAQLDPPRSSRAGTLAAQAWPVQGPDFMAIRLCAGITYTMGGIAIDASARVRAASDGVIDGLYAAGSTTGGLDGGEASVYLGGLARAATFGLLAGEAAAAL
ncbi:MAG: FAD-binding protein [Pseudorhodobacter sp.]|jgi:fumarate reductase flavoprotein subunit|nr:MAG: FAD-binding protein [Pseudorhodobacter sp.]